MKQGFAETEGEVCPDCKAVGPGRDYVCLAVGTSYQMWHTSECPQWTIMQIDWEAGSRRMEEQDARAKEVFPAAHERLKLTAAEMPPGTPAQPFVDALIELVQAQADTTGFVGLHQWADILERHFPSQPPGPDRTTE